MSEVYDEEILIVGLDDAAAGTVWVTVEVMVFDCVGGMMTKRRKEKKSEMNTRCLDIKNIFYAVRAKEKRVRVRERKICDEI